MAELLYLALLAGLVAAPGLRRVFRAIPRVQQVGVALLVAGAFAGQALGRSGETYPFIQWFMYSRQVDEVDYFRYRALRPGGAPEPLPLAEFVRIRSLPFVVRMRMLALGVERAAPGRQREEAWRRYREVLLAGLAGYERRHPGHGWTGIEVSRCRTDVASHQAGAEPRCTPLWELDLRREGSG